MRRYLGASCAVLACPSPAGARHCAREDEIYGEHEERDYFRARPTALPPELVAKVAALQDEDVGRVEEEDERVDDRARDTRKVRVARIRNDRWWLPLDYQQVGEAHEREEPLVHAVEQDRARGDRRRRRVRGNAAAQGVPRVHGRPVNTGRRR